MRVPLSWLREFVDITVERERLAKDLTLAGLAVDAIEDRGDDVVFDLDITTNRVDCMNVYGVAREVSVLYGLPVRTPVVEFHESGPAAADALKVTIEAPDLCPRFCAAVLDVRLGPSPAWLRDRLEAVGVRSISNVVDLTNYVMMELGQPSHAFDLAKIPEGRLNVRWVRGEERLQTLDGALRTLGAKAGVVAGSGGPLALAGIMGGAASEVSDATTTVALEAAYWEPLAIRRAAKALGMHTEASHRFERGADPEGPLLAIARFAHLLEKIGAGSARPGLIDVQPVPRPKRRLTLRAARIATVLGIEVPLPRAEAILSGLGFGVAPGDGAVTVEVPSWRGDVTREVDLVEEVARHHGLDKIPSTIPAAFGVEGLRPAQARERLLRTTLIGAGLSEVITHGFVARAAATTLGRPLVELENPLAEGQEVLRRSIVVPGLLSALATNLRQGRRDVALFEIGRVFLPQDGVLPEEQRHLGILLTGSLAPPHWSARPRAADVFDAKGLLELLAQRLRLGAMEVSREGVPSVLHPGVSAAVSFGGRLSGYMGLLHPDLARAWEFKDPVIVAELGLDALLAATSGAVRARSLPRFPEVARDLSVVWDTTQPAEALEARVRASAGELLREVTVSDRYEGPPVPAGKVSLTLGLRFQHAERTLTGDEVQQAVERAIHDLKQAGVDVRGE
jgi:phenylalanyl-tRNA synthetase beta chain